MRVWGKEKRTENKKKDTSVLKFISGYVPEKRRYRGKDFGKFELCKSM